MLSTKAPNIALEASGFPAKMKTLRLMILLYTLISIHQQLHQTERITNADATPKKPTYFKEDPGANFSNAPTGLNCVFRPIANSAMTMDRPTKKIHIK